MKKKAMWGGGRDAVVQLLPCPCCYSNRKKNRQPPWHRWSTVSPVAQECEEETKSGGGRGGGGNVRGSGAHLEEEERCVFLGEEAGFPLVSMGTRTDFGSS